MFEEVTEPRKPTGKILWLGVPLLMIVLLGGWFLVSMLSNSEAGSDTSRTARRGESGTDDSQLLQIIQDDKWGYMDGNGTIVITPRFEYAFPFSEGLAPVAAGSDGLLALFGYINRHGQLVIAADFLEAGPFASNGLAYVRVQSGKRGYINRKGVLVIPPRFDTQLANNGNFVDGLAEVKVGDKHGYIDQTGELVIPAKFDYAGEFSEGLAVVGEGGQAYYIDRTGNPVIRPAYDHLQRFSEGLAAVGKAYEDPKAGYSVKWGYIDKAGKVVVPAKFVAADNFSEGLAVVSTGREWAYVDRSGAIVIPRGSEGAASRFSEGLASVSIGPPGPPRMGVSKCGYIDRDGNMAIEPQFWLCDLFRGGLASVTTDAGRGYIDRSGAYVWKPTK